MANCPLTTEIGAWLSNGFTTNGRLSEHLSSCGECQLYAQALTDDPELEAIRESRFRQVDLQPLIGKLQSLHRSATTTKQPNCIGNYEIRGELGRGGMGVVYHAFDPKLRRDVAIKVLRWSADDVAARKRLIREAQATARLTHNHIVPVYDVHDPPDAPPYLVLRYVSGTTLRERLKNAGPLPPREAARVIAEVADGLAAAHAAGLIHRDVKPGNILIDQHGRALLTDFGLAKSLDQTHTMTEAGGGTPDYMSPEQIRAPSQVSERSDIYSLGATLYETLSGLPLFRGSPHQVIQRVLDEEPVSLRRLDARIPRDLDTICAKAIAKHPSRRYSSAKAFADDLRHWLAGRPIQARPVGTVEKIVRGIRRRPLLTALCSFAVVALIATILQLMDSRRRAIRDLQHTYASMRTWRILGEDFLRTRPGLSRNWFDAFHAGHLELEAILAKYPSEPGLTMAVAASNCQIGMFLCETGDGRSAKAALQRAIDLYTIAKRTGQIVDVLETFTASASFYLAILNCDCGWVDDAAIAADAFRGSVLRHRSSGEDLDPTKAQSSLGSCDLLAGDICKLRGQFADAERYYRSALTTYKRLSNDNPVSHVHKHRQAKCHYRLGRLFLSAHRPADAESELLLARPGFENSTQNVRDDVLYVRDLARLDLCLAQAKMQIGKHAEVEPILAHAIDVLTGLTKDCPDTHDFHAALGFGCQLRSDLYRHNDQADLATEWAARAEAAKTAALKINPVRLLD